MSSHTDIGMSSHTPEPWGQATDFSIAQQGSADKTGALILIGNYRDARGKADVVRAVKCVNACRGLNPEALAEFIEAAKALREGRTPVDAMRFDHALRKLEIRDGAVLDPARVPRQLRPALGGDTQSILPSDWRLFACAQSTGEDSLRDWGPEETMRRAMDFCHAYGMDVWLIDPDGNKHSPDE